jgi:hypothetical protein
MVGYSPDGERMEGTAHSSHEFIGISNSFGPFKIKFIERDSRKVDSLIFRYGLKQLQFDRIE